MSERPAPTLALAAALAAVVVLLLARDGDYVVHAKFVDAGQLVRGNVVQVGGVTVGTVGDLELTPDGHADVELRISDSAYRPLPEGTVAAIRALGLAGVANRFVQLSPPAGRPRRTIPDGGEIDMTHTRPIVDLDAVLNALDPRTRANIQAILRDTSAAFAGRARDANRAFAYLNPALKQTALLTEQLARDRAALEQLLAAGAQVSGALAERPRDLEQGLVAGAANLRAIARERASLQDSLALAPGILRRGGPALRETRRAFEAVPAVAPLVRLLRALGPTARETGPLVEDVADVLPSLRRALREMTALEREAVPAMRSATGSTRGALPIFAAFRPYATDYITGFFNGFQGAIGGYYDANGHYLRIAPVQGSGGTAGIASLLASTPPLNRARTGLVARCPGAATQQAPDRSNPWVDDAALCDRRHDAG